MVKGKSKTLIASKSKAKLKTPPAAPASTSAAKKPPIPTAAVTAAKPSTAPKNAAAAQNAVAPQNAVALQNPVVPQSESAASPQLPIAPPEILATPTVTDDPINADEDFQKTFKAVANGMYPVSKYVSRATGMEILHVEVPGPVVSGYIVLGTLPDSDDGIPHCLEHLVFLGSENYPYKGMLDEIAYKCMSSGTNAWTDSDHTCYTFETAGQDGFCCLLPIFLEHLFHPTLTDSAFLTQVHHITHEGKDGGVVYSEMLSNQHSAEARTILELSRALYPDTSPYYYESGGILKNLRKSCNNQKVAAFHKLNYTPKNLRIIICGILDRTKLFACLVPVTQKLKAKEYPAFNRPVVDNAPATKCDDTIHLLIPANENENDNKTLITVALLGPSIIKDLKSVIAMRFLMEYFCDSAASPLELEFVEGAKKLCNSVDGAHYDNAQPLFYFEFEGAEAKNAEEIVTRLRKVLTDQTQKFDMNRMAGLIVKSTWEEISSMENSPREKCAYAGILDFLFGDNDPEKFETLMSLSSYKFTFLEFKEENWTDLIKKHFLEPKWITVVAEPSEQERKRISQKEAARIQERMTSLGESGLAKLHEELEAALALNDIPISPELLRSIPPKQETSISKHTIQKHVNPTFINDVGCNLYVDDIDTHFIYITIHMDTTSLEPELRKYLSIFREAFTESPMKLDDGQILPFVDVVQGLTRDINYFSFSYGLEGGSPFNCASFQHIFCFKAQMEMSKVDVGFEWIHRLLFNTTYDLERIKMLTEKMQGDIRILKNNGLHVMKALMNDILYKNDSNMKCTGFVRQEVFLKDLYESLPQKNAEVEEALYKIKFMLTLPQNMTVHIATSLSKLEPVLKKLSLDFNMLLKKVFPVPISNTGAAKRLANSIDLTWMHTAEELMEIQAQSTDKSECLTHKVVLGSSTISSGHVCVACTIPVNNFNHPDICALEATMQYFCHSPGGPFYRAIRGGGYAYNFWMKALPNEGILKLTLDQCSDAAEAFSATKKVLEKYLNGEEKFDHDMLVSAKSRLSFDIVSKERTPLKMSAATLQSYYKDTKEGHTERQMTKLQSLTPADLEEITKKYLSKLFAESCICTVVCPNGRLETEVKKFQKLGYEMQIVEELGDCSLAKWKV